jgi:hypothetical protein
MERLMRKTAESAGSVRHRADPLHVGTAGAEDVADIRAAGQVAHSDLQQPSLEVEILANAADPERFSV